nr:tRNA adenosine(34) deaminase TadA [uncultured Solibaculum sp.]
MRLPWDETYMNLALQEARKAQALGEVPVGAVMVRGDQVVGRGYNRREVDQDALAHAEVLAIAEACRALGSWRLDDCTLYVTLEPCPMCAGAILNARVKRVVYGASDPKAGSVGSLIHLFELPFNHRPAVTTGVLEEQCSQMLSRFFRELR